MSTEISVDIDLLRDVIRGVVPGVCLRNTLGVTPPGLLVIFLGVLRTVVYSFLLSLLFR